MFRGNRSRTSPQPAEGLGHVERSLGEFGLEVNGVTHLADLE